MADPEKRRGSIESSSPGRSYNDDAARLEGGQGVKERRLVTKIDYQVLPYLCVLYLLAFLDRVNIGNAAIFGLQQDLKLKPIEFNTALTIFFIPYIIFEIPSNILLKRLRPNIWLSGCMFSFGFILIMQGLVQNYGGLLTTRFLLGLFETGMFPGCFYLISMWYTRYEAQKRYTFFFGSTSLAGAFGGLLASAIGKMDGLRGYRGWRWIFILEGVLTCVVALAFFFLIPTFPEEAKWLSEEEKAFIKNKLEKEQGDSAISKRVTWRVVLEVFKDYKIFIGGIMYLGLIVPAYGYAYFSPTIIQSYGYSQIGTQLHSVPPFAAAFVFSMIVAFISDRVRHRFLFAVGPILICISGFAILLSVYNRRSVQYAALFLVAIGAFSAMPVIICWFSMNLGGHHRRSVGVAWQIGFGNIGGIIATYSFMRQDAPRYRKGYGISVAFACLSAVACIVYFVAVYAQNKARDKKVAQGAMTEHEEQEQKELGDMSVKYRYLL